LRIETGIEAMSKAMSKALKTRPLGKTGIEVSPLALGTVKLGRNQGVKYPEGFELPSDQAFRSLLDLAWELGINFLDTAPAYGISEERLGKLLKADPRNWVIGTKVGEDFSGGESLFDFTPEHSRKSVERSLKHLGKEVLDLVLVHSDGNDLEIIEKHGTLQVLADLKKKGLIRAFGMSTKTLPGALRAVDQSDVVMLTYNPRDREEEPAIDHAHENQKGVLIKKGLLSGHLDQVPLELSPSKDPIEASMRFIFSNPGVTSLVVGTLNSKHLRANVEACLESLLD
jgi:aryl-alcohol dehydrogenase-like predicted oxidoreductase